MPSVTSIVARSYPDYIIGRDNKLPWHLRTDLQIFKERTKGHAIIMGRKTFESLGGPLKNRVNIVLSRTPVMETDEVKWANNPETAILFADAYSIFLHQKDFFVIGGEQIYGLFDNLINKVLLTEVFCGRINGDAKFDRQYSQPEWRVKDEIDYAEGANDEWPFRITHYERKIPFVRTRRESDFKQIALNFENELVDWKRADVEPEPASSENSKNAKDLFN